MVRGWRPRPRRRLFELVGEPWRSGRLRSQGLGHLIEPDPDVRRDGKLLWRTSRRLQLGVALRPSSRARGRRAVPQHRFRDADVLLAIHGAGAISGRPPDVGNRTWPRGLGSRSLVAVRHGRLRLGLRRDQSTPAGGHGGGREYDALATGMESGGRCRATDRGAMERTRRVSVQQVRPERCDALRPVAEVRLRPEAACRPARTQLPLQRRRGPGAAAERADAARARPARTARADDLRRAVCSVVSLALSRPEQSHTESGAPDLGCHPVCGCASLERSRALGQPGDRSGVRAQQQCRCRGLSQRGGVQGRRPCSLCPCAPALSPSGDQPRRREGKASQPASISSRPRSRPTVWC